MLYFIGDSPYIAIKLKSGKRVGINNMSSGQRRYLVRKFE
ncbi:hypothetical protein BN938_2178 [Mucinivorans hirudinis]|uniref:Uncharacterized protein n=1 Tax=Mucinivorans hirudinis TaxID=1433126 RepID=A0A060R9F4_9BACT|nr:hypothetical protein BN938_2178 [Mucinivorans hirudinis]